MDSFWLWAIRSIELLSDFPHHERAQEHPCFSTQWSHTLDGPRGSGGACLQARRVVPGVAEFRGVRAPSPERVCSVDHLPEPGSASMRKAYMLPHFT